MGVSDHYGLLQMKDSRRGILAAGNWIIDRVKVIDHFPEEESLAIIQAESRGNGGGPYNLLKDLALLGVSFRLEGIGLVGEDDDGDWILADCTRHGIDTRWLHKTREAHTAYTDVMTNRISGKRTFFHYPGTNVLLQEKQFHLEESQAKIFYLGYVMLLDGLDSPDSKGQTGAARLLEKAVHLGMQTAVDVVSENSGRFQKVVRPVLPWVDFLLINEYEAEKISGVPIFKEGKLLLRNIQKAARQILKEGVRRWVIIHFPEGALALSRSGEEIWQGSVQVPAEKIAGTAGAGDAFAAGVLLGIHEGWPIRNCLQTGACVAAASLFHPTCSGGMEPLEECLSLGHEYGFRALRLA